MQACGYCNTRAKERTRIMAMLAERKSKQKWSNDPRNTNWTNGKELIYVIWVFFEYTIFKISGATGISL